LEYFIDFSIFSSIFSVDCESSILRGVNAGINIETSTAVGGIAQIKPQ